MRRMTLAVAVGFALAYPALPLRPALADDASLAAALAGSESEAKAQWEKRLPELVAAFEKDPESPYAMAALNDILSLIDEFRGREIVEQRLEPVLTRGIRDGDIDEMVRDVLADRARARGEIEKARGYEADRGYLHRWAAVGPIGWSDTTLVHRRYGPEDLVLDPKATWEGSRRRVGWTPLVSNPDSAWVDPWSQLRDGGAGMWYAVGRVKSAGARDVALKIHCRESFKVFVNGREVVVADRERDFVPGTVWTSAHLVDGWNRILVKVAGRGTFAVKVCDASTGLPLDGLEEGEPLEAGACAEPGAVPDARVYRSPAERAIRECLDNVSDPARVAVAASLADDDGRTWDAFRLHEKAAAGVSGSTGALAANVHTARGLFLAGFGPFPPVQRKLGAQKELQAALAAMPEQAAAAVRLAEYENEDDHPDKAVKALREANKRSESFNAWMSLARIARARGWEPEAEDAAKKALALQPMAGGAIQFLNDTDRRLGDAAEVEKRLKQLLEIDRSSRDVARALIGAMRAQGRYADALKSAEELAARWPMEHGWKRMRADLLGALGRDDEALAQLAALEKLMPLDEGTPRRIAEMLEVRGDKPGALAAYRRSLAVEAYQPSVWRAIARLDGKAEDFASGYEPDIPQLLAALPTTDELKKKYPKAVAVTVLDHSVVRVDEHGNSRAFVHMIYKVLDEKGVEKHGDLPNAGETLQVRAILPDGTVTTPTGLHGQNFNIEGLVPGTILDQRFTTTEAATVKGWDGGKFYFQDQDIDQNPNPVLLSRYVVITPESLKIEGRKRNYEGDPKVETKDGVTTTIWEKRDLPIYEAERNRPAADEIFPLVDYSIPAEFDDAPWELFASRTDSRGSPMVDEAVAKCVKPGMSDMEKLRAIYDWVNTEITGDSSSGQGATAVLMEKAGNRALLFESMIRTAGVKYRLGKAMPWNGSGRKLAEQDASAFSGTFLWLEPKGEKPLPFMMLGQHAPFGLLPEAYRGSFAFLLDETGGRITRLESGGADTDDSSSFTITLGADEKSTAINGVLHFRSPNGYGFKRALVDMAEDDRRKFAERQMGSWFANPKLDAYELPKLAEHGAPLDLVLRGTMSTYVVQQGDGWVVSLGLPETSMSQRYVDKAERQFDLILNGRDDRVDEYVIDLGSAWSVKSLPQDHTAANDVGVFSLTWRVDGDTIHVRRERHFHPARYRPDEYKAFVAWCKSIDDAEDRKLVMRKAK